MKTIYLVEDDRNIRETLATALRLKEYHVLQFDNGLNALKTLKKESCDLVILDITMPVMDGNEFIREIRSMGLSIPILVLTAKSSLSNTVQTLDLGADDYLTKPPQLEELYSRVNALLRRSSKEEVSKVKYLGFEVDFLQNIITLNSTPLELTEKEFKVLSLLIKNNRRITKTEDIYLTIWGQRYRKGQKNLNVYITYLRNKINLIEPSITLTSIRGSGYKIEKKIN